MAKGNNQPFSPRPIWQAVREASSDGYRRRGGLFGAIRCGLFILAGDRCCIDKRFQHGASCNFPKGHGIDLCGRAADNPSPEGVLYELDQRENVDGLEGVRPKAPRAAPGSRGLSQAPRGGGGHIAVVTSTMERMTDRLISLRCL